MSFFGADELGCDLLKNLANLECVSSFENFDNLKENYSKVNFVEQLLLDRKYIKEIRLKFKLRNEKCNKTSLEYRMLGNEKFSVKNKNYYEALELYNKSICFAAPDSENLAIGYANRSAVFFQLKRYRECLDNIKLARKANYPARLMHKLDKREKDCLQELTAQAPVIKPYDFKMSFAPHAVIPNIAECLEMAETPEQGRFIRTTRDLAVGDLVATEEPFCTTLLAPMRYIRCATCKAENSLTLIPCEQCCSTMFCSESCREQAINTFHKYECPIIDLLYKMFNGSPYIALRVCLTAVELFSTIAELMSFCKDTKNKQKSVFDLDYTHLTSREVYRAIHGMVTHQNKRSQSNLFQNSVMCAILKHFVIGYTPLKQFLGSETGQNFFTGLLFQHLLSAPINMHGIDLLEQVNATKVDETHSLGAYAFLSLSNHSCAPNTLRVFNGTKAYLFVFRPIPAGGALYDNYGQRFYLLSTAQRNEELLNNYFFTCKCEACINDYPTLANLLPKQCLPNANIGSDYKILFTYDYEFALNNYRKYCGFLMKYAAAYPCQQLSLAEECLRISFQILVDAVPFKAKIK